MEVPMNRTVLLAAVLLLLAEGASLVAQELSPSQQIAASVLPLPEALRPEAAVVRVTTGGDVVQIRVGTNGIVCRDDFPLPEPMGFVAICYHESVHPLMERRRELYGAGIMGGRGMVDVLTREGRSGELSLPTPGVAGYAMIGSGFDATSNTVTDPYRWQFIFVPFQVAEETGLSGEEVEGMPWVMYSGEAFAHIMLPVASDF
jgi:hypothetical protein